jgi:hypothetical protein
MQMINLLPLGSVVLLQGGQKKIMIYGRMQKQEGKDKIWDYIGCLYPEGNIRPESSYLFDHQSIETVFFKGYQNSEELEYRSLMSLELERQKNHHIGLYNG